MKFLTTKKIFIITFINSHFILLPQQNFTDDAAITAHKAIKVGAWYGKNEIWILPSVHLISPLEITCGSGFVKSEDNVHRTFLQIQAKALYKELTTNSFGIGFASGVNISLTQKTSSNVYTYIPFSKSFLNDFLIFHQNIGWAADTTPLTHSFLTATRFDVIPVNKITLYGEIASANFSTLNYQLAFQCKVLQDNLAFTISYYGSIKKELSDYGILAGFEWTPSPWF